MKHLKKFEEIIYYKEYEWYIVEEPQEGVWHKSDDVNIIRGFDTEEEAKSIYDELYKTTPPTFSIRSKDWLIKNGLKPWIKR